MFMGCGVGAFTSGMFHVTTHAFFKALLFLGAGSVIHAMHHEQDIWRMGALRKKMPATFWTFLFATLALAGVWPLSGFYSKDEVLGNAVQQNPVLFGIAALVAVLTTFYMFRLVFVVFYGAEKSGEASHAHESPSVMVFPLVLLAIPTLFAGFFGIDYYIANGGQEVSESHGLFSQLLAPFTHAPLGAVFGLGAVLFGFCAAWGIYYGRSRDPLPEHLGVLSRAMRNRFYFDEIYNSLIGLTHENLAKLANGIDRWIIGGVLVKGAQGSTDLFGRGLRMAQTGNLQTYAFLLLIGVAALLYFFFRP
jgi:NADH-quinone oxidoreductase subunit L